MSYDVIILHGSFGSPHENWFPWLYRKLSDAKKAVICPHFPTPEGQSLPNWSVVMDSYLPFINENTTLVAHSIAPAFACDYILQKQLRVKRLISVVPFYGIINIPEFDAINESFFIPNIDLSKIAGLVDERISFFSDNDPYVPRAMSECISQQIKADIHIISNGKHLNASAGFTEAPFVLQAIAV